MLTASDAEPGGRDQPGTDGAAGTSLTPSRAAGTSQAPDRAARPSPARSGSAGTSELVAELIPGGDLPEAGLLQHPLGCGVPRVGAAATILTRESAQAIASVARRASVRYRGLAGRARCRNISARRRAAAQEPDPSHDQAAARSTT